MFICEDCEKAVWLNRRIFICGDALTNIIKNSRDDRMAYMGSVALALRSKTPIKKKCGAFEVDTHEPREELKKTKLRDDVFKALEDYAIHLLH